MNKKMLLFSLALGACYITFSSYKGGPATSASLNRTGAAGTASNCSGSGCHAANSSNTFVSIAVLDTAGGTETSIVGTGKYTPGKSYKIVVNGSSPISGKTKFGFQSTITNASNITAGTLFATEANTRLATLGSLKIVEHTTTLSGSSTAMRGTYRQQGQEPCISMAR